MKRSNFLLRCCTHVFVEKAAVANSRPRVIFIGLNLQYYLPVVERSDDDSFSLPWSAETEQCLLVVSLGVFLQRESNRAGHGELHDWKSFTVNQQQATYCDSLLQRLPKALLVFRTNLFQVHLTAGDDNSGHYLLFGSFTLRTETSTSQQLSCMCFILHYSRLTQDCCKTTSANFGFRIPAAILYFPKQKYFLHLFGRKKKKEKKSNPQSSHISNKERRNSTVNTFMASLSLLAKNSCLFSKHWTGKTEKNWMNIHSNTSCMRQLASLCHFRSSL